MTPPSHRTADAPTRPHASRILRRFLYPSAAVLMVVLVAIGFRHYYLEGRAHPGREIPPPIRTLVTIHGLSMSAWVLLFLVQSLLVAFRRVGAHRILGSFAAVFAVSIVVSGLMLSIQSARVAPPDLVLWAMTGREFMAISFFSILLFGAMVAIGVWHRKRPEIHRPMMLFATLSALAAAIARIDVLNGVYQGTAWERLFGPFLGMLVVGALIVAVHWAATRRLDRWIATSYAIVLAASLLIIQIARTGAWDRFVAFAIR